MTRIVFYILFSFIISNTLLSEYSSYTVKKGDTLYGIVKKHSMNMDEFLKINKIKNADNYKMKVGEKLKIELNEIFTLAYDKDTKSYAMLKIEKPRVSNTADTNEINSEVKEKEIIVAKDNIVTNEERVITTKKASSTDDTYTVVKGDTLYGIAFKHDMKVSDFLVLNDIKDSSKYNLMVGTKLKVKKIVEEKVTLNNSSSTTTENKKENNTTTKKVEKIDTYTAEKGDTLYGIAFKHDMKVSDFFALNDIKDSSKYNLMVGTKLKVKKIVEEKVTLNNSSSTTTENKKENNNTTKKVEKIDTYTAQKGDTLYGIAFKHDMKVSDFFALNDIKDSSKYNLMVGSKLKVKKIVEERITTPSTKENTLVKTDENKSAKLNDRLIENYTVKNGDTLSEIAEYFGMDLIDVYILNKFDNKYVLKVGDKLYVYKRVATDYNTKKYTVKSGDTLYSIARNNNMSLDDLLSANNIDLKKYTLKSGAQLKVYKKETIATSKVANQEEIKTRVASSSSAESNNSERPSISLSWPYRGSIIETYGVRKDKIANRGINISGNSGDKVVAAYEGIVEYVGTIRGFGNVVIIKHADNYTTSYAHLSSSSVTVGDFVQKGDKIGAIGNTGIVDKNELYFKVSYLGMPINPLLVLPKS